MPRAQRISGQKRAQKLTSAAREKRRFNMMRKREPLIAIEVLRALAALNLPNDKQLYTAKLNELLEA